MTSIRSLHLAACTAALCLMLPAAQAAGSGKETIRSEVRQELAEARREVSEDLATARLELQAGNLEVGNNLRFGKNDESGAEPLPKAEITPDGDFLIEGETVAIDSHQRQDLLAYRGQVIDIALAGIDIGEHTALAAIDAVDRGMFRLVLSAMTGNLERRLEKGIKTMVEPMVMQICQSLPALYASQQQLAGSVPQFRPYATLESGEAENCEQEVRQEFASIGNR